MRREILLIAVDVLLLTLATYLGMARIASGERASRGPGEILAPPEAPAGEEGGEDLRPDVEILIGGEGREEILVRTRGEDEYQRRKIEGTEFEGKIVHIRVETEDPRVKALIELINRIERPAGIALTGPVGEQK
jgi:hypothetical protein